MIVRIEPSQPAGTVQAPPSKSWAHRMLIAAGLADGTSTVRGLARSQDILATCDCLRALGAEVSLVNSGNITHPDGSSPYCDAVIKGTDPCKAGSALLCCRESGSTLRFFIPLCAMTGEKMRLSGSERLLSRPLKVYEDIFAARGVEFSNDAAEVHVCGKLRGGRYTACGSISSQFISGLLFALPLAEEDSVIELIPPVESRSYIDITLDAIRTSGIDACWIDENTISVRGGQKYNACDARVECDWSNAAFFLAMGIDVSGLNPSSLQSDRVCADYFARLDEGCAELDISDCPDLGPVLMAYAAMRSGCVLTGTRRLRIKESDRGEAMKEELAKFGVDVDIEDNRIIVGSGARPPAAVLDGHNDHRIVMAMSVMSASLGGTIAGAEAVSKSFPDYFDRLEELEISIRYEDRITG